MRLSKSFVPEHNTFLGKRARPSSRDELNFAGDQQQTPAFASKWEVA
jgi:hypothetical protein